MYEIGCVTFIAEAFVEIESYFLYSFKEEWSTLGYNYICCCFFKAKISPHNLIKRVIFYFVLLPLKICFSLSQLFSFKEVDLGGGTLVKGGKLACLQLEKTTSSS